MKLNKKALATAIAASLALTACGGSSGSSSSEPTPPTTPTNSAPTDITLSSMEVAENEAAAVIGNLSATDANSADTFTYTVDNENFSVSGAELSLAEGVSADFETMPSYTVNVTVTDNGGLSFSKEITINVTDMLDTYAFASKFMDGESSVSYTGQIARHVLIAELNNYIANDLQAGIDDGSLATRDDVLNMLNKYYRTTETQWDGFPIAAFGDDAKQKFMADISSSYKQLNEKIAGNDDGGQEKDWNIVPNGPFAGWGVKGSISPEGLIDVFFDQLADNAEAVISGVQREAFGEPIKVYINDDGTDLKQLIQKFLLMAVTYSQATGDYLGEDTDGKGLTTDNIAGDKDGTKAYSKLEHQFDEGFGYFGAARDYLAYNDNEIAGKVTSEEDGRANWNGKHDTDGDGLIDLTSEFNFGQSVNAAKRDRGATNETDYTKSIMESFLAARNVINENAGMALTTEQMAELLSYRDVAVDGWEKAIAATVVHYINDTNADLDNFGTADFNYADLAKHWSELKGFALGLQFSPFTKISDEKFEELHSLIGDKPVLEAADIATYQADLIKARDILETALEFNSENVANW